MNKKSTRLPEPFHPDSNSTVFAGRKPAEKASEDLEQGQARLGGFWRRPSYLESYRVSASLLIEQGRSIGSYDEIGLPVFYLQRHATELLLKRMLGWCINIIELKFRLSGNDSKQIPCALRRARTNSHDLKEILKALKRAAGMADVAVPPAILVSLVERIDSVENSDHWSRYDNVHGPSHHEKEATLPIVELQDLLDRGCESCIGRGLDLEGYEMDLYCTHESLSMALEQTSPGA